MLFLEPDPKVPLSMLPHISSLLWITTTGEVTGESTSLVSKNRNLNQGEVHLWRHLELLRGLVKVRRAKVGVPL